MLISCVWFLIRSNKWVGLKGLDERTAGSLIPETLQGMEKDEEFQLTGMTSHTVLLIVSS